MSLLSVT